MPGRLERLVYYSNNCIAGPPEAFDAEIRSILAVARHNNATLGLTGALMFNQGCFAQVLEGPPAAVAHTFSRIERDRRHGALAVLARGPVPRRVFEHWSMAYVGASPEASARYADIAGSSSFDPARMSAEVMLETLHRLVADSEVIRKGSAYT